MFCMSVGTPLEQSQRKLDLPEIRPGDTVRVHQRVIEGDKSRVQKFEGMVIARKHGDGVTATMTVRAVMRGIGVERIYPIHSPVIERVEVLERPRRVRRAKLYFIREKAAKAIRKKLKAMHAVSQREVPAIDGMAGVEEKKDEFAAEKSV